MLLATLFTEPERIRLDLCDGAGGVKRMRQVFWAGTMQRSDPPDWACSVDERLSRSAARRRSRLTGLGNGRQRLCPTNRRRCQSCPLLLRHVPCSPELERSRACFVRPPSELQSHKHGCGLPAWTGRSSPLTHQRAASEGSRAC